MEQNELKKLSLPQIMEFHRKDELIDQTLKRHLECRKVDNYADNEFSHPFGSLYRSYFIGERAKWFKLFVAGKSH